jgi:Holliday junction DNA helicase RuvA
MIRYLRGKVMDKTRNAIIVDVNGVGYDLLITATAIAASTIGQEAEFHISESIREDAHDLFGFTTTDERDTFEMLRKVSGVGPKVALAILSFYQPQELRSVIRSGDSIKVSLVPGIGKKLADKIILELKDKAITATEMPDSLADPDTVEALQSLGYSPAEIAVVLPKIPASLANTNERITWILRHLAH